MQIEFTLTFDDYCLADQAILRATPSARMLSLAWTGLLVAAGGVGVGYFVVTFNARANRQRALLEVNQEDVVLLLSLWLLILAFTWRERQLRRTWNKTPALGMLHRVRLNDAACVVEDPQTRVELPWNWFRRYVETPEQFLLLPANPWLGIVIPKRVFNSAVMAAEFRRTIDQRIMRGLPAG